MKIDKKSAIETAERQQDNIFNKIYYRPKWIIFYKEENAGEIESTAIGLPLYILAVIVAAVFAAYSATLASIIIATIIAGTIGASIGVLFWNHNFPPHP